MANGILDQLKGSNLQAVKAQTVGARETNSLLGPNPLDSTQDLRSKTNQNEQNSYLKQASNIAYQQSSLKTQEDSRLVYNPVTTYEKSKLEGSSVSQNSQLTKDFPTSYGDSNVKEGKTRQNSILKQQSQVVSQQSSLKTQEDSRLVYNPVTTYEKSKLEGGQSLQQSRLNPGPLSNYESTKYSTGLSVQASAYKIIKPTGYGQEVFQRTSKLSRGLSLVEPPNVFFYGNGAGSVALPATNPSMYYDIEDESTYYIVSNDSTFQDNTFYVVTP